MNVQLRNEGRKAVEGLLRLDKMQLIYWLLKARQRDHWLLNSPEAARTAPGANREDAEALKDFIEHSGVDPDSASHHFLRFCGGQKWWVCSECGVFTTREERTQTEGMHGPGCKGLCAYRVTACDFFEESENQKRA